MDVSDRASVIQWIQLQTLNFLLKKSPIFPFFVQEESDGCEKYDRERNAETNAYCGVFPG